MRKEVRLNFGIIKVFGAILSLTLVSGFADDTKPTAAKGEVTKNAISADADGHCIKAKGTSEMKAGYSSESGMCDKSQMKTKGKHADAKAGSKNLASEDADCPKAEDCPKDGQCLKHKTGKTKGTHSHGDPVKDAVPAVKPDAAVKSESQPG